MTVTGVHGRRIAFSAGVIHGRLQLTLRRPAARVRITIRYAALRVTGRLSAAVRRHHRSPVTVSLQTLDAAHHGVRERARIRPSG